MAAGIAAGIVVLAAIFLLSPWGKPALGESSCDEAAEYHYREALTSKPGAMDHFWAGMAAEQLQRDGKDCHWEAP